MKQAFVSSNPEKLIASAAPAQDMLTLQHHGTCSWQSALHSGCPSHISPDSTMPFPHTGGGSDVDDDVEELVLVDVVVLVVTQPPTPQASQHVGRSPTQPPRARQSAGFRMRHRVVPASDGTQQVA
jgi:hypothetical protein